MNTSQTWYGWNFMLTQTAIGAGIKMAAKGCGGGTLALIGTRILAESITQQTTVSLDVLAYIVGAVATVAFFSGRQLSNLKDGQREILEHQREKLKAFEDMQRELSEMKEKLNRVETKELRVSPKRYE